MRFSIEAMEGLTLRSIEEEAEPFSVRMRADPGWEFEFSSVRESFRMSVLVTYYGDWRRRVRSAIRTVRGEARDASHQTTYRLATSEDDEAFAGVILNFHGVPDGSGARATPWFRVTRMGTLPGPEPEPVVTVEDLFAPAGPLATWGGLMAPPTPYVGYSTPEQPVPEDEPEPYATAQPARRIRLAPRKK